MSNQPAFEKDNPFVRLANEVAARNVGRPAGRSFTHTADRPSQVTSGAMVRPDGSLPEVEPNLPPEEIARLNRLAVEAGVLPGDMLARDDEQVVTPTIPDWVVAKAPRVSIALLPDFTRIQSIDVARGVIIVDDMEFPVPESDLADMRTYALEIVTDAISQQILAAYRAFNVTPPLGKEDHGNLSKVLDNEESRQTGTVPDVRDTPESGMEAEESGEATRVSSPDSESNLRDSPTTT